jgi:hypothetical protein
MPSRAPRQRPLAVLALLAGTIALAVLAHGAHALLDVAPALALIAALLLGLRPGERAIDGLRRARTRRTQRPAVALAVPRPTPPASWRPAGALLLALRLASRPPPRAAGAPATA